MAEVTNVTSVTRELEDADDDAWRLAPKCGAGYVPTGVEVYEINGPFFFGAAETFKDTHRARRAEHRRC